LRRSILAIDPGDKESGAVIWNGSAVLLTGVFENERLASMVRAYAESGVDKLAIEEIGHYGSGMAVGKEVFNTCRWIGRFEQRWLDFAVQPSQLPVMFILRATIKAHLCGTTKAKDANVRQAVIDRLGQAGTKKSPGVTYGVASHAWQALALALVVTDLERIAA
jgi:hypothetical protein